MNLLIDMFLPFLLLRNLTGEDMCCIVLAAFKLSPDQRLDAPRGRACARVRVGAPTEGSNAKDPTLGLKISLI